MATPERAPEPTLDPPTRAVAELFSALHDRGLPLPAAVVWSEAMRAWVGVWVPERLRRPEMAS